MFVALRRCSERVRCYSTSNFPPLPPISEWKKVFQFNTKNRRVRVSLSNVETAARVAESFFPSTKEPADKKGKIVIEAFPGPGVLTRALLELPTNRIRKLIVLEDAQNYFPTVKELENSDPRLHVFNLPPFSWDSYDQLEHANLLDDIEISDWQKESEIEFVCHIPHSILGEQFVAQLLRAIPQRSWLFKYGRMRMSFLMAESLYNRVDAPLKKRGRCKLSVIAEATTGFRQPLPPRQLKPYEDHFWPPIPISSVRSSLSDARKPGHPMVAATFLPLENQIIQPTMMDKWDYCLRRLFVLKKSELRKALPFLAPGANNMMQFMQGANVAPEDRVDLKALINELTVEDWARVIRAFNKWPFAPDILFIQEGIKDNRM